MTSLVARRLLAFHLAIATFVFVCFVPVVHAESALLSGRVMETDGFTPRSGVVVALVDDEGRRVYRSDPTNEDGAFRIDSAPAGGYKLLAETDQGAFLASNDFRLAPGENQPVSLKLTPADPTSNVTIAPGQTGGGKNWWQWVIAGTIIVAGLLIVSDASSSDEPQGSPMN
ncbi:MAG: carboxypeptidase regulatory-like domain-containing protein [Acidobacteria bacterium]|nr:carboxypeptidase regulatory-like domain-containing protein [Acidobacteriota bacterium]